VLAGGGTHSITGSSTMCLIKVIEPIHGHHPLKYRTAGFHGTVLRLACQQAPSREGRPSAQVSRPLGLHPALVPTACSVYILGSVSELAVRSDAGSATSQYSKGRLLRSGLCCPGLSTLMRSSSANPGSPAAVCTQCLHSQRWPLSL
jgi:hypothetical protein